MSNIGDAGFSGIPVDTIEIKLSINNKSIKLNDNSLTISQTEPNLKLNLTGIIKSEKNALELEEMLSNKSYSIIDFRTMEYLDEGIHGYYEIISGEVSPNFDHWIYRLTLGQKLDYKTAIIGYEEIETDWDIITEDDFTETGDISAPMGSSFTTTDGNVWYAVNGGWRVLAANDYLECLTDNGWNHCIVLKRDTSVYLPGVSNVIVTADIYLNTGIAAGLCLRSQNNQSSTTYGYCYGFYINTDGIRFYKWLGTTYKLLYYEGIDFDIDTSVTYELKVICTGNRFDCFIDGDHIITVWDDEYQAGWYGVSTSLHLSTRFDNFKLKYDKRPNFYLPQGTFDTNQIFQLCQDESKKYVTGNGKRLNIAYPWETAKYKANTTFIKTPEMLFGFNLIGKGSAADYIDDISGNCFSIDPTGQATFEEDDKFGLVCNLNQGSYGNYDSYLKVYGNKAPNPDNVENNQRYQFTFAGWFYIGNANLNDNSYVGFVRHFSGTYTGFDICNGFSRFGYTGGYYSFNYPKGNISDTYSDQWVFITYVFDYGNQYVYVNGNLWDSDSVGAGIPMEHSLDDWHIGANDWNGYGLVGKVGPVAGYNKAFTANEVLELYKETHWGHDKDTGVKIYDTNGNDGYWKNLKAYASFNQSEIHSGGDFYSKTADDLPIDVCGATLPALIDEDWHRQAIRVLDFDGISSHLRIGNSNCYFKLHNSGAPNYSKHISYIIWVKLDSTDNIGYLWSKPWNSTGGYNYRLHIETTTFRLSIATDDLWEASFAKPDDDEWHCIAVSMSAGNDKIVKAWIDGRIVLDTVHDVANWTPTGGDNNYHLAIMTLYPYGGAWAGNTSHAAKGKVAQFLAFDRMLTDDDASYFYKSFPHVIDESNWSRVYNQHHEFKGDMIVDTGVIRFAQKFRQFDDHNTENNPYIYGRDDYGTLTDINRFFLRVYGGYQFTWDNIKVKSMEKHKVILTARVSYENYGFIYCDIILTTDSPIALFKFYDWDGTADFYIYGRFKGAWSSDHDYNANPIIAVTSLDTIADALTMVGNIAGNETEGLSIATSRDLNQLYVFWDQDNTYYETQGVANSIGAMNAAIAIDRDIDNKDDYHYTGIGLIPFRTRYLVYSQRSTSNDDDFHNVGGSIVVDANAAHGYAVELNTQYNLVTSKSYNNNEYKYFPPGSYRVFVRAKDTNQIADDFGIAGYNYTLSRYRNIPSGYKKFTLTASYVWYFADIVVNEDENGDSFAIMSVKQTVTANVISVDQMLIVPISDGMFFPLSARNQTLGIIDIQEAGE